MGTRGAGRKRTGLLDVVDGIEAVFYGVGGLIVLVVILVKATVAAQGLAGPAGAGAVIVGCLTVIGLAVRDVQRRRWSVASIGLAAAFAIAVGALILNDALAV